MKQKAQAPDAKDIAEQPAIPAGSFSAWLDDTRRALLDDLGIEVPCGDCRACCKSSYFIHIKPDEKETLSQIDKRLVFPAPGLPRGNKLLGYFENGQCPLLNDDKCSIYEHRSRTCRAYDCRIFAAAGMDAGDDDKWLVTERARRWKFSYPSQQDLDQHIAVQKAARFMKERAECFPEGKVPGNPSQLSILAIKVYNVFLNDSHPSENGRSDREIAQAVVEANEEFEARRKT
ncbi:MAG: YkgJ family cysteine cluster protein [Syntrophomonas sp.]